jgi:hypothetical protein
MICSPVCRSLPDDEDRGKTGFFHRSTQIHTDDGFEDSFCESVFICVNLWMVFFSERILARKSLAPSGLILLTAVIQGGHRREERWSLGLSNLAPLGLTAAALHGWT